ncbi:MAG: glutamyl-tRNA reductase [Microscillaceae bacterium]|nr:glutamyl-tRNA reductase [Microscillaceae bacterium]MDW8461127.1 glutamyl-tRNA reductase [Cytophagales bacterium]
MQIHFKALALSYKTAILEVRDAVALSAQHSQELIQNLMQLPDIQDILVLSTCNRTEIYYASPYNYFKEIINQIICIKQIDRQNICIDNFFTELNNWQETAKHLYRVALGLESQVVGDMQIINQVKQAYQLSADLNAAGPFLHRLLHSIFFANKRVVQETNFRSGAASVSYATVELVEELAERISNPKVLVLGLGEIGADVCRNFENSFVKNISICNRTFAKAEQLAKECNAHVIPFEQVWQAIQGHDIIISSIATAEPFITYEKLKSLGMTNYKYLIDLSVPRSIEPQTANLKHIELYNIDSIHNKATQNLEMRLRAIPQVEQIIEQSFAELSEWVKEMEISPTLQKFKNALEQIRREELARYAKNLSPEEVQKIDSITKSMMQKIIKQPAIQLKNACKRGEAETLIEVLHDLFNLEKVSELG